MANGELLVLLFSVDVPGEQVEEEEEDDNEVKQV